MKTTPTSQSDHLVQITPSQEGGSERSQRAHKDRMFAQAVKDFLDSVREAKEIPLKLFQRFQKSQEQRLKRWHGSGGSGREIVQRRSDLIDILFKEIFDLVVKQVVGKPTLKGICVGAFGGYGRREMNPFSDVDIMFIHKEEQPTPAMEKIISSILMVLWDLGFKVGHATRSIGDSIEHANKEMLSKTAMLECRILAGDKETFKSFKEKFKKHCILGHEKKYIAWRLENLQHLREKFGKSVFMQEPNIKSGSGGLRDYQNILWIAIFKVGTASLCRLVELKFLRESERKKLENSYDFLLRVRNEMHYQEVRANDQLTLLLQGKVATALGYPQRHIIRRSEAFMKDYYERTRDIFLITSAVLGRMKLTTKKSHLLERLFQRKKRKELVDGFLIQDKMLFPIEKENFSKDSSRMMQAFYLAQLRSLDFSPELSDLIKKRLKLIDRTFQYSKEVRGIFLAILARKGEVGRILRMMHDLGFLGKYLPEFGALTCLVQHEFYHRYTADEHTLVCIEKIDNLFNTNDKKFSRYTTIFKNLDDPAMLYLGMLLHDTGKAANVRCHAEASTKATNKVVRRLQLTGERGSLLLTLVESHGELGSVARTRNLDDFTEIQSFATIVKNLATLDTLMILTLADGMGTGDAQWSDWKEQLVWSLYDQTKRYLEVGASLFDEMYRDRSLMEKKVAELLPEDFKEEIRAHFELMPERYFRTEEPSLIAEHLQLFRSFFVRLQNLNQPTAYSLQPTASIQPVGRIVSPLDSEVRWIEHPESGHTEVWICGWDRKQLLERIAEAFLSQEINILSADVFTRGDDLTFDIFRVTSVRPDPFLNEKEKKLMEFRLRELLELIDYEPNKINSKRAYLNEEKGVSWVQNVRVDIDNQSHPIYTLVEIEAPDRCGLFYDLLRALHYRGISIDLARITTERKAALDTFYILGADRKKITDQKSMKELKQRLLEEVAVRT